MRSAARLAVLQAIIDADAPLSVPQIATAAGIDLISCYALVYTLRSEGHLRSVVGRPTRYAPAEIARRYGALPAVSVTRDPGTVGPFGRVCGAPSPESHA